MHLQVTVADPGQAPTLPPPPLLFLDQTEARRAGKKFSWVRPSPPPPEGLDPVLSYT